MADNSLSDQDRSFIRRLTASIAKDADGADASPIAPMLLAGWLDRTLSDIQSEEVEDALLRDPDLLGDLLALTRRDEPPIDADPALIDRLCGLVEVAASPPNVIPMPMIPRGRLRRSAIVLLSWGAVAASVAVVSLVGFDLGSIVGKTEISQTTPSTALVSNDDFD